MNLVGQLSMIIINSLQDSALSVLLVLGILILGLVALVFSRQKQQYAETLESIANTHRTIEQEIRTSIRPRFITISPAMADMIELAVEVWRVERRFQKISPRFSDNERAGLQSSIRKLSRYLEKNDIEIIEYTNQKFNEGLNVDVLSVEKDGENREPKIKETVEPAVLSKGQIVRRAKVVVLAYGGGGRG